MTWQTTETLRYKGKNYHLREHPLSDYLKAKDIEIPMISTACYRGYYGSWEISSNRLLLTELRGDKGTDIMPIVFGAAKPPILAAWYSGKLRFSLEPLFMGFHFTEGDVLITDVNDGIVGHVESVTASEANNDGEDEEDGEDEDESDPSQQSFTELKALADHFYNAKKWEQAAKAYEEAAEVDEETADEDATFCFNWGYALIQLERWYEAESAFEKCTDADPDNAAAWSNRGLCLRNVENWSSAMDAYESATDNDPKMVNAWKGRVACAEKLNNVAERICSCEALVELLPDDSHWRNELGRAYLSSTEPSGAWRALGAFLDSARLGDDPCHPSNAGIVYKRLGKCLDAADAFSEAIRRRQGYSSAEKGLDELRQRLLNYSAKIWEFSRSLQGRAKEAYVRYLNPFDLLSFDGALTSIPEGPALRKLKTRTIQHIRLSDGRADWLEGADIGESRAHQVLDDLDDEAGDRSHWHWIVYNCLPLNRFLSHGDPSYFAFFGETGESMDSGCPYWPLRDKSRRDEAFFAFIHTVFLGSFEPLLARALDLNDADLVQALCCGRLPAFDGFDYFRRANKWMEDKAEEIKGYIDGLAGEEGVNWWKTTKDPMAWLSVPLANALPDECKAGRTELGRTLRLLCFELQNEHGLTDQALKVATAATQLAANESLSDQLTKDTTELQRILNERKKEETRWDLLINLGRPDIVNAVRVLQYNVGDDQIEVKKAFVRHNSIKIAADKVDGLRFGILRYSTNGTLTFSSYAFEIQGDGKHIKIECNRGFQNEAQAKKDFTAILQAFSHQILPPFVIGLAERITKGSSAVQIGPLCLTKYGVQCERGAWWWKKQVVVPYHAWTFHDSQGNVHASASQPYSMQYSLDRRSVWNAVVLEKLVEIIKLMQSQPQKETT